jgi:hypothetical protein
MLRLVVGFLYIYIHLFAFFPLFLQYWTDSFVQWSPLGTYLATVHRQGAAVWGGKSTFNRIHRFPHNQVCDFLCMCVHVHVRWMGESEEVYLSVCGDNKYSHTRCCHTYSWYFSMNRVEARGVNGSGRVIIILLFFLN